MLGVIKSATPIQIVCDLNVHCAVRRGYPIDTSVTRNTRFARGGTKCLMPCFP